MGNIYHVHLFCSSMEMQKKKKEKKKVIEKENEKSLFPMGIKN